MTIPGGSLLEGADDGGFSAMAALTLAALAANKCWNCSSWYCLDAGDMNMPYEKDD